MESVKRYKFEINHCRRSRELFSLCCGKLREFPLQNLNYFLDCVKLSKTRGTIQFLPEQEVKDI